MASEYDPVATPWSVMAGMHAMLREDVATAEEALAMMRELERQGWKWVEVNGPEGRHFTTSQLADYLSPY